MLSVILFNCCFSFAAVRRVGFTDVPPVPNVDYLTFYKAYTAAQAGDTIYVFAGKVLGSEDWPTTRNWPIITKKLVIIGRGNLLDTSIVPKGNINQQVNVGTTYIGGQQYYGTNYIYFNAGSEGSVITGFNGSDGGRIVVGANNINVKRNYNIGVNLSNVNVSNLLVENNYRVYFEGGESQSAVYDNIIIRNNLIYSFSLPAKLYKGIIENNVWAYDRSGSANGGAESMSLAEPYYSGYKESSYINLQNGKWLFQNNLIIHYQSDALNISPFVITGAGNTTFNDNLATASTNATVWPNNASPANKFIEPSKVKDVFEAFPAIGTYSADSRYRLKANSPANKANRPGSIADAGMYGGNTPYRLSTIPSIPTIYMISSPQGNNPTGNTLQINISTRSNN